MATKPNLLPSKETLDSLFVLDEKFGELYWRERPDLKAIQFSAKIDDLNYSRNRIVWKIVTEVDPVGFIFHKDLDKTNCAPSNLMDVYQFSLNNVDGSFHCKICADTFEVVYRKQYKAYERGVVG